MLTNFGSRRFELRAAGWVLQRLVPHSPGRAIDLSTSGTRVHEREIDLAAANEKAGRLLFTTTLHVRVRGTAVSDQALAKLAPFVGGRNGTLSGNE